MARAGARRIAVPQAHAEPAQSGAGGAGRDQRCVAGGRCLRSLRSPELGDQVLCGCADAARGDPVEVIRALQDVLGPRGTLMMPTLPFTGSAIEYTSRDLVFDVRRTPSRMGFITEVFRRGPEVVRSLHPTHSVAVWGNNVDAIVAGHHVAETPCGRPTPYGRLLED